MPRERLCRVCGGWHRLDAWPHNCAPEQPARSRLSAPMVIGDTMDPVRSMLDGKLYDSKAHLRATYKAAGVVEVGNDAPPNPNPAPKVDKAQRRKQIEHDVGAAISQAGLGT